MAVIASVRFIGPKKMTYLLIFAHRTFAARRSLAFVSSDIGPRSLVGLASLTAIIPFSAASAESIPSKRLPRSFHSSCKIEIILFNNRFAGM
jgi:hypothetical protein